MIVIKAFTLASIWLISKSNAASFTFSVSLIFVFLSVTEESLIPLKYFSSNKLLVNSSFAFLDTYPFFCHTFNFSFTNAVT